ncbi:MAG: DUF1800 domain-containing protein [Rhodospirillaceae bacterium]|nr:DUF1800 domain-containing protein [Rhodospirillaceae bacterium]
MPLLPEGPNPQFIAVNRCTFGARDSDVAKVQSMGWAQWVEEQLNPPAGDDPMTRQMLMDARLRIAYGAQDNANGVWPAVDEERPLQTLWMTSEELFKIYDDVNRLRVLPTAEITRIAQEVVAAQWIRNTHSPFQIREFMADFWHRHFNVATAEGQLVQFQLPIYDTEGIRQHALGNFTDLVNANARSAAMLFYLDNAVSRSTTPNENYARELLELHTMGADAYLGVTTPPWTGLGPAPSGTAAPGFSDQDILQASRALSGWTVALGQRVNSTKILGTNARFVYEPAFHNRNATTFLGVNLAPFQPASNAADQTGGIMQGNKVIELAAQNEKTAVFIVTKLCRRIWGDEPPQRVIDLGVQTWLENRTHPEQIKNVVRMILNQPEIWTGPAVKLRRPYEKMIAFARVTNSRIRPTAMMNTAFAATKDAVFLWGSPDGWPDENGYWLSTAGVMTQWNNALTAMSNGVLSVNLRTESIQTNSVATLLDDWIGRIVGYQVSSAGYAALRTMASTSTGIASYLGSGTASTTTQENELRRLVALISTAPEFAYR